MPQGWESVTLDEVGIWGSGGTPKASESSYYGGEIPWVRSGDLHDAPLLKNNLTITQSGLQSSAAKWVAPGSVLVAMYGATVGKAAITTYPVTTNQAVAFLTPLGGVSAEFLFHYFRSTRSRLIGLAQGGAQPNISQEILKSQRIQLPPRAEQRRIVTKLDTLTKRIVRARAELSRIVISHDRLRTTTLRQAVTGTLTQRWRVQTTEIEAVAKVLGRIPVPVQGRGGREATDKVIPGIGGLSVNDPGSDLPLGWQWVSLLRVSKQETGHTPSRSQPSYWDGGVPWVGIRDAGAHHGQRINETVQTISDEGLANSSARLLPAGTVCLSRTASVGYVTILGRPMATSQDFATWTCGSALLPEYLMLALLAEGDDIRTFGMGSTHTTIYFPEIRALHIALPPLEEQREIVARTEAAFARADRVKTEAARAAALLDRLEASILAKAFHGGLVPQDPADEPASALLDRFRADRAQAPMARRGRGATKPLEAQ